MITHILVGLLALPMSLLFAWTLAQLVKRERLGHSALAGGQTLSLWVTREFLSEPWAATPPAAWFHEALRAPVGSPSPLFARDIIALWSSHASWRRGRFTLNTSGLVVGLACSLWAGGIWLLLLVASLAIAITLRPLDDDFYFNAQGLVVTTAVALDRWRQTNEEECEEFVREIRWLQYVYEAVERARVAPTKNDQVSQSRIES